MYLKWNIYKNNINLLVSMWRLPLFVTSSFSGGTAITKNKNIEHVNDSSVQHLPLTIRGFSTVFSVASHTIFYYPVNCLQ